MRDPHRHAIEQASHRTRREILISAQVSGPAARVAATLDALPDGRVLLSGGWDPATGGTFDDVWALAL